MNLQPDQLWGPPTSKSLGKTRCSGARHASSSAFIVIGVLGIKLLLSLYEHFYPEAAFSRFLASPVADWSTSALTVSIFLLPLLCSWLFNFPERNE